MEAIVAVYADWGIGANGTQPIVVSEDRKHFREITQGSAIIVGRRTLEDFPHGKPLKGRTNIVLTSSDAPIKDAVIVKSVSQAAAEAQKHPRAIVVGGASVYNEMFSYIEKVHITKIECTPKSDVFFPNLDDMPDWHITQDSGELESENLKYRFITYEKK